MMMAYGIDDDSSSDDEGHPGGGGEKPLPDMDEGGGGEEMMFLPADAFFDTSDICKEWEHTQSILPETLLLDESTSGIRHALLIKQVSLQHYYVSKYVCMEPVCWHGSK